MITYHNAIDKDGHTIHINEITNDNRAEHYYCIGCGEEMRPVLGEVREHHFRHKETHCSWESYLHKLGKRRLKERFDTQEHFIVKINSEYYCDKDGRCKLGLTYRHQGESCNRCFKGELDLKRYYDTCEEEISYEGFRADLLLSNKNDSNIMPMFLEISVSHDCEPKKIASRIPILEIKVTKEEDLECSLEESTCYINFNNPNDPYDHYMLPSIRLYNFPRRFKTNRPLKRFWVSKDNKGILRGFCDENNKTLNCQNVTYTHREDSLYELSVPAEIYIKTNPTNLYELGMIKANLSGIAVRKCNFCTRYSSCIIPYNEEVEDKENREKKVITRRVTIANLSEERIDKVELANICTNYCFDYDYARKITSLYKILPMWEWRK